MKALMKLCGALALLTAGLCATARAADSDAVELRVMTFNIWYGGDQLSFGQVLEAIRAADPDIAGIQEPDGNLRKIADALGYSYVDERRHIISRYPLFDASGADDVYTRVELLPGRIVAMANTHLPATPYGPEAVRDGEAVEAVLQMENDTRLAAAEPYAAALGALAKEGVPVFLTGDFNSPSHLDWTEAVAKTRPAVRYPVEWPVSRRLADAGLRDSYREANPDPVARPGLTWTPGYPYPRVRETETHDRIDLVFTGGDAITLKSELVGEPEGPDVDIAVGPWPSDHRAVVSTFRVVPAVAPAMIGVDRRRLGVGELLVVRFNIPGMEDARISVIPQGSDAGAAPVLTMPTGDGSDRPSMRFGTGNVAPGAYDAVLLDPEGKELARTPFWLLDPAAKPNIAVDKPSYAPSETITVTYRNAPGLDLDYVGLWAAGDPDVYNYYTYVYTGGGVEGSVAFDAAAVGDALEPGEYEMRLMLDDSYTTLAVVPFTVK